MTPAVLALLALALSGPVPALLPRLTALRRVPRAAVTLWQSVALAAVLAAVGAALALATDRTLTGSTGWWEWLVAGLAVALAVLVVARLAWSGHVVGRRLRTLRRRHRSMVDLLGQGRADLRVLDHETPLAYCVPGLRGRRLVLSSAVLRTLSGAEVAAVLAHERAHLRARHDLVLEAFTVLRRAFPRWVSSGAALDEVRLLVELLADRAAVRRVGATPLARALARLAGSPAPESALAAGGSDLVVRMQLMADHRPHRLLAAATYVAALLVLALPTALVALPWLADLAARLT